MQFYTHLTPTRGVQDDSLAYSGDILSYMEVSFHFGLPENHPFVLGYDGKTGKKPMVWGSLW